MKKLILILLLALSGFLFNNNTHAETVEECKNRVGYILGAIGSNGTDAEKRLKECENIDNVTYTNIIVDNSSACRKYGFNSYYDNGFCRCDAGYYFIEGTDGNKQCLPKDNLKMCGKKGVFLEDKFACGCEDGFVREFGSCVDYTTRCKNIYGLKSFYDTGTMTGEYGLREFMCGCSSGSVMYEKKCVENPSYIRGMILSKDKSKMQITYNRIDTKTYIRDVEFNSAFCGLSNAKKNDTIHIELGTDKVLSKGDILLSDDRKLKCSITNINGLSGATNKTYITVVTKSDECVKKGGIWNRKKKTCKIK